VASAGWLVPGLGLQFAGHRRAAAACLWLSGPLVFATLVMWNAGWLWSWNLAAGSGGLPAAFLEWLFLGVVALGCTSAVAWIVQALEGVRRTRLHRRSMGRRGDWTALALAGAIAVFVVAFEPADVARDLDALAISLEQDGYRVLPLHLARATVRLDPSRPGYLLHAMELHQALGQGWRAQELRAELEERMGPYVSSLRREGWRRTSP
jgi:hypothetical protein